MQPITVDPARIAKLLGLRKRINSIEALEKEVAAGLPTASLDSVVRHVFGKGVEGTALRHHIVPPATRHRHSIELKPQESERVERLARVVATAEQVWDDDADARAFLTSPHSMLEGRRPIDVALSELGARRVETLLWSLFHGISA